MRALTVLPGTAGSLTVSEIAEPERGESELLVQSLDVGICGTDREIVDGRYGQAPEHHERLVLGHENLGRVLTAPPDSWLAEGDLVVGIVRRPDPIPCAACLAGEWDMCLNGLYTEHGIHGLDGFARERWTAPPASVVSLDPALAEFGVLLEPTTIVAKAWEQIYRIGSRAYFEPRVCAVLGAGPVGLLAAMLGVARGLEVHVFDIVSDGPKPALVEDLGATYHCDSLPTSGLVADVVIECTGVPSVVIDAINSGAPDSICCLTGVSSPSRGQRVDIGSMNRRQVLGNHVIFGSVNANRRHYEAAAQSLRDGDHTWITRLISRRVPLADFADALRQEKDDIKVVLEITEST